MRETDRVVSIVEAVPVSHVYRFCIWLMCIGHMYHAVMFLYVHCTCLHL